MWGGGDEGTLSDPFFVSWTIPNVGVCDSTPRYAAVPDTPHTTSHHVESNDERFIIKVNGVYNGSLLRWGSNNMSLDGHNHNHNNYGSGFIDQLAFCFWPNEL